MGRDSIGYSEQRLPGSSILLILTPRTGALKNTRNSGVEAGAPERGGADLLYFSCGMKLLPPPTPPQAVGVAGELRRQAGSYSG